jgi:septum site-determining protein MinC
MNAHVDTARAMNFRAKSLLAFALEPTQPFTEWLAALDAWLTRSPNFFSSKPVILEMAGLDINLDEYRDFLRELTLRHVRVMAVENPGRLLVGPHLPPVVSGGRAVNAAALQEPEAAPAEAPKPAPAAVPLIVDANVRSGQSIVHPEGDVTIVGRVASGAEIIAGGSVHIYGALHGRVIAGISGAPGARIFCREARAELLCIGGAHVTSEQMDPKFDGRALEARLVGEDLVIRILD